MPYVAGRLFTGQVTSIGTVTAVQLGAGTLPAIHEVLVQNDPGNAGNMLVGNVTNQYMVLTPGQAVSLPVVSLTMVYVKMVSGTGTANWLATE